MAVDVEVDETCKVLPKGWLSCDACGRIMPAKAMGKHLGSTACMYECTITCMPPGWQPILYLSGLRLDDLWRSSAPTLRLPQDSSMTYTPTWVHIVIQAGASSISLLHVLNRASHDHEYRACVVAGLRLISSSDIEAAEALIKAAETTT